MTKRINLPITDEDIKDLNAGDSVLLTGTIITGRDAAHKRLFELIEKGEQVTYDEVLKDIEKRDYNDSHREIAPLKPAEDSVYVDTSDKALDESVALLIGIIKEKI